MLDQRVSVLYFMMAVFAFISLFLLSGCADREELEETRYQLAPGYNAEANKALEKAEKAMKEADIEINFSDLSGLESMTNLREILPDPLQIAQLEKAGRTEKQKNMEDAVDSLYGVLDTVTLDPLQIAQLEKQQQKAGAPARLTIRGGISNTDLALINLHLSYCYIVIAVSRLAWAGAGPDGIPGTSDDLYRIRFSRDPESMNVYEFELTDKGQQLIDSVDPDVDPYAYIKAFYDEGHLDEEGRVEELKAMIDALMLLLGAEVAVIENLEEGIMAHEPTLNRQIYRHDALYHLTWALALAQQIAPELEDALDELDETITDYFSKGILEKAREWGLKIRSVPSRYEYLLEE